MRSDDEAAFRQFLEASGDDGVHIVCAAGTESIAAAALLAKALARIGRTPAATTVLRFGERLDAATIRSRLGEGRALLLVGLRGARADGAAVQLSVDGADDGSEPLAERAFRLAGTVAPLADAVWCAAIGLILRAEPHALVERALARSTRAELSDAAALLDAAARGPSPAAESFDAFEMLVAVRDLQRFLGSEPAEALRRTQALVHAELARAARVRPRPGFGVVVVEYDSTCRVEDLVAERWRGLRAGTVVLVANGGAADGSVAVTAKAAMKESVEARLGSLRPALADEGATQLDRETWTTLRERLGVAPSPPPAAGDDVFALPN